MIIYHLLSGLASQSCKPSVSLLFRPAPQVLIWTPCPVTLLAPALTFRAFTVGVGSPTSSRYRCTLWRWKRTQTASWDSTALISTTGGRQEKCVSVQMWKNCSVDWFSKPWADSVSLIPFTGFSGSVLTVVWAFGPSPPGVTPARLMLYCAPGVKFSRR